jgi:hypothetical protein
MQLTTEDMKMLAALERRMDCGEQPYVVTDGGRMAFPASLLDECGIVSGQTVSHQMTITLMEMNLANLQAQIAIESARNA